MHPLPSSIPHELSPEATLQESFSEQQVFRKFKDVLPSGLAYGFNMTFFLSTELKPHQCQVCSKTFAEKYNLDSHFKTHSGIPPGGFEKRFKCDHCSSTFDRRAKLDAHLLKIHRNETSNGQASFVIS
jgi:hypothetical protein